MGDVTSDSVPHACLLAMLHFIRAAKCDIFVISSGEHGSSIGEHASLQGRG